MDTQLIDSLEAQSAVDEAVQRERKELEYYSKQGAVDINSFFASVYGWGKRMENEEPPYKPDSRKRDTWLRNFVRKEPHLWGVINSIVAIDKNRGWTLVGGRNQVIRWTEVFHNWEAAPGMFGWRAGLSMAANSFYLADLGSVIETGREGKNGPVRAFYPVDSARCHLTGDRDYPLKYFQPGGKATTWRWNDFIRIVPLPSTDVADRGLGNCAVSRAAEIAKIMIAVYEHDLEQLGAKAPKGLLLLQGVSERQWKTALNARDVELQSANFDYFTPVAVLASADTLDAKLVALSQLPTNFTQREFTDMMMYAYALTVGYDPSEFWPVQFGALGRGKEADIQAAKATGKGGLDFMLSFQEQIQEVIPDALQFEVDRRDQDADLLDAHVRQAYANVVKTLREIGEKLGQPSITNQEARALLSVWNVLPDNWTDVLDDTATDTSDADDDDIELEDGDTTPKPEVAEPAALASPTTPRSIVKQRTRRALLEQMPVWRAAELFPNEPIVRYHWPSNRIETIWERGSNIWKKNNE